MNWKRFYWSSALVLIICVGVNCLIRPAIPDDERKKSSSFDPETDKFPTGVDFHFMDGNELEEEFISDVDEDLIRKAEMAADEDLLGGLKTILKKNETLEDLIRIEGVSEFP